MTKAKAKSKAKAKAAAAERRPVRAADRITELGPARSLRATSYDAARTTDQNALYWRHAADLSPRAASVPAIRRLLRTRARYECANNCYAAGLIDTFADYIIGTGPRLQVLTDDDAYNSAVESAFAEWAEIVAWGEKLHLCRRTQAIDGESFALLVFNPALRYSRVPLDVQPFEADLIDDDPTDNTLRTDNADGVVVDDYGNPIAYRKRRRYPSEYGQTEPAETIAARNVLHMFRPRRAGQLRGVSEIAPALLLWPTLRRYTLAALAAAETAARISGVIKSTFDTDDPEELDGLDAVDLPENQLMTLPAGWDVSQLKAEQPTTTYGDFKREIVAEAARCLGLPYNLAANDSAKHNFASAKLDYTSFFKTAGIEHRRTARQAATPTFREWYFLAARIPGYLPTPPAGVGDLPPHAWQFDGVELLDPREATSQAAAVSHGLVSLASIHAKAGRDTATEQRSAARALGVTLEEYQALLRQKLFGAVPTAPPTEPEADDENVETE